MDKEKLHSLLLGEDGDPDINPHMPQYIVKAPWYLNQTEPSLKHQRAQIEASKPPITLGTIKGTLKEKPIYKFRKGACTNCGALTHSAKECCERPRKKGAAVTGKDFKPDEYIFEIPLDFEGKRDRWRDYDPNSFKKLMYEFEKHEEELKLKLENDPPPKEDIIDELEDDVVDAKNLKELVNEDEEAKDDKFRFVNKERILEDFSKYLINLDPESAYYDSKSRSMRGNPHPEIEDTTFKGDNYARLTGDTMKLLETEEFINTANENNSTQGLNNISMPTQAELFYKYYKDKKIKYKSESLMKIMGKYGGEEHFDIPETVKFVDNTYYSEGLEDKKIKKAFMKKSQIKSKYPEDTYSNGHKSVWGSFFHKHFGWGYKCCYSFDRNSYCKGLEEKKENLRRIDEYEAKKNEDLLLEKEKIRLQKEKEVGERDKMIQGGGVFDQSFFDRHNKYERNFQSKKEDDSYLKKKRNEDQNNDKYTFQRDIQKEEIDKNKLKKSILKQKKGELKDEVVTAEDMEAYKMLKQHFDDPIKNLK